MMNQNENELVFEFEFKFDKLNNFISLKILSNLTLETYFGVL